MIQDGFDKHVQEAAAVVNEWPAWKQTMFGGTANTTNVDIDDDVWDDALNNYESDAESWQWKVLDGYLWLRVTDNDKLVRVIKAQIVEEAEAEAAPE